MIVYLEYDGDMQHTFCDDMQLQISTVSRQDGEPLDDYFACTTNSPYEPDFSKDFHVSEPDANNWIRVTYQKPLKPSPEEFRHYTLPAEQYTVEFVSEPETFYKRHRGYDILSADGTKHYSITQDERDEFQFNCRQDDELRYLTVGSYPAVLVQNATRSILRWDDGQYAFSITGDPEEWEILLEIAQSLTPTETITE